MAGYVHIVLNSLFALLFFISPSFAQYDDVKFDHITVADGLPNNNVKSIIQDHLGFLWFTTQNGLIKYDGYEFKIYVPGTDNPKNIPTRNPIVVLEDHLGDLWITSRYEGLIKYERETETFKNYKHNDKDTSSIVTNNVYILFEDSEGVLWIGTYNNGVEKFNRDSETFTHYSNEQSDLNSLSSNFILSMTEDMNGHLWIGTVNGLNRFNRKTGNVRRFYHESGNPNSLVNNQIHEIIEDHLGNIWIATAGGISRYNYTEGSWENYFNNPDDPNSLTGNYTTFVFEDSRNRIWIGTRWSGLNLYDPVSDGFYRFRSDPNDPTSLNSDYIVSMNEDRSGVLWFGCWLSGLNKLDLYSDKFKHYKHIPGITNSLNNNWVWCLYNDSEGIIWLGTRGGGLNRFDPVNETFKSFLFNPVDSASFDNNSVYSIFEDKRENLWVGTNIGLTRFNKADNRFITFNLDSDNDERITNSSIMSIVQDSSDHLWIATIREGLIRINLNSVNQNNATFTRYLHNPDDPNSLGYNRLNRLYIDSEGTLWIGTDIRGLDRFYPKSETFQHYYDNKTGFDVILSIYEDRSKRFWVGTYNGGLHLLNRETGEREIFTTKDGLPHHSVKDILEDETGNLWISTERGLSKFNYEKRSFRNYTVSEGLQSGFFNMRAATMSKNGELYFGGINGFNRFAPDRIADNPYPPEVLLSDIRLFDSSLPVGADSPLNRNINIAREIELSYDQNDLTLEFVALHYSRPEEITYEYKLENYDKNWRKAGKHRLAVYTNLRPDNYTFLVKAKSADGVYSETPASLHIVIMPPYWQTLWFRILMAILFVIFLYSLYKIRIKQLDDKRKLLEERVTERTEAAEKLQGALNEVESLKNRLHQENIYLQDELKIEHNFENIISTSNKFNKVLRSVEQVASTDSTVLIQGETGTGKELLARAIHSISRRSGSPLVKVNCATLPENLIESELFGHEKGAFTGATSRKIGRFELADKGTIFLDEIGELTLGLQTKLLRVLQEGEFERLGNPNTIKIDVRILAATNRDLEKEIKAGTFREDLFFRLNVFPINIPPLRERTEDIPLLVKFFLKKYNAKIGKRVEVITKDVMEKLQNYPWPGNVRELENFIERSVITSKGNKLVAGDWLSKTITLPKGIKFLPLDEMEKQYIINVLEMTEWKVSGEKGAAKILDINPQTLVSRMKKLGIQKTK